MQRSFQGPLPPPEHIERYQESLPNAADRLFSMAERQAAHRHALELEMLAQDRILVEAEAWSTKGGLFAGTFIATGILATGAYVAVAVHAGAGATIITGTLAAVTAIFVYGRKAKQQEQAQQEAKPSADTPRLPR